MSSPATSLLLPSIDDIGTIDQLRRVIVRRSLRSYADWVRDAIGWGCVVYMLLFLIAFLIMGLDEIPILDPPLSSEPLETVAGVLIAIFFLRHLLPRRMAPVTLSRPELHRLALAPVPEWSVMKWSFLKAWSLQALTGLVIGGIWTFVTIRFFSISPILAAPVIALLLTLVPSLSWITWLRRDHLNTWIRSRRWQLIALLACLIGLVWPAWGPAAPFYLTLPPGLLWYPLLAGGATLDVYRTITERYPPSFGHQCHLRNQLRHLTLSRYLTGELYDPALYRRLVRQLRGRVIRVKPLLGLPPFPLSWGSIGLVAWRSSNQLLRRPFWSLMKIPALACMGGLFAAFLRDDVVSVLFGTSLLGFLFAEMLGLPLRPSHIPIRPLERTLGRILPGFIIAFTITALAMLIGAFFVGFFAAVTDVQMPFTSIQIGEALFRAVTVLLLGLVGLEKISVLSKQSHRRMQIFYSAGFVAILPSLIVGNSGPVWLAGALNLLVVTAFLTLER